MSTSTMNPDIPEDSIMPQNKQGNASKVLIQWKTYHSGVPKN